MSPQAKPESKIQSIISELNEMAVHGDRNEFTLKRLKIEADKIKSNDPEWAFTILGMIACIEKDIESVHRYHKNAIAYASSEKVAALQYYVSLYNLEFYEDAIAVLEDLYQAYEGDTIILDALIKNCAILNRMDDYSRYCEEWTKITEQEHQSLDLSKSTTTEDAECMEMTDLLVEKHPDLLVSPDENLMNLAKELIEGVEV